MKTLLSLVTVVAVLLALAAPAAAHDLVVAPGGGGSGTHHWVGGGPVPGNGQALVPSPIGLLPPSHMNGLPQACYRTSDNPSAVTFIAPPTLPFDADPCQHGVQLSAP